MATTPPSRKLAEVATDVRAAYDADIVLYFGPVDRPYDDFLIDECDARKKHKNVLLCITTLGGNANAAYRIARALQRNYCQTEPKGQFLAYVNGVCASAGTLLVTGANRLILSNHAELGPLDVQLRKADEVGERTSGLTPIQALQYLKGASLDLFHNLFVGMRLDPSLGLHFSTSLGSKLAAEMTAGLIGRLYEQLDPLRVAEINRWLSVASDYGRRIERNLKEGGLDRLLLQYPAHDFVIDPLEAREIFEVVEEPHPLLEELSVLLKPFADRFLDAKEPRVCYIQEADETSKSPLPAPAEPHSNDNPPDSGNAPGPATSAPLHNGSGGHPVAEEPSISEGNPQSSVGVGAGVESQPTLP
jgi:hypothetical protein